MADRLNIEINPRLVPTLLRLAQEQGRGPDVIIEEAFLLYLRGLGVDVGLYVEPILSGGHPPEVPLVDLFEQIDQGQRERGVAPLSEEEAMQLASEELHAMRREGGAGRRQRVER